jgi:hypothetical protein
MELNYMIWDYKQVEHAVVLDSLKNVENTLDLYKGISRADDFPADAEFHMHPDRIYNTLLVDSLKNINLFIVASLRLTNFFREWGLEDVEYLPVSIIDHKQKAIEESYTIIHPINPVDCLDVENCGAEWSALDKTAINYLEQLALKDDFINKEKRVLNVDRKLFKPKFFNRVTFVRRDLAEAINAEGFSGIEWVEISDYSYD